MDFFKKRAAPGHASQIKGWVAEHLGLSDADLVTIAELTCHEPDCPPVETVVTVHKADNSRQDWRIHKPISEIAASDVSQSLNNAEGRRRGINSDKSNQDRK